MIRSFNDKKSLQINYTIGNDKVPVYIVPVDPNNSIWNKLLKVIEGKKTHENWTD